MLADLRLYKRYVYQNPVVMLAKPLLSERLVALRFLFGYFTKSALLI